MVHLEQHRGHYTFLIIYKSDNSPSSLKMFYFSVTGKFTYNFDIQSKSLSNYSLDINN